MHILRLRKLNELAIYSYRVRQVGQVMQLAWSRIVIGMPHRFRGEQSIYFRAAALGYVGQGTYSSN